MSGAVVIRRCASAEEAAIVCALLNDAGIPASLENWHHAMIHWGVLPALGGVGVHVPAGMAEQARQVIIEYVESAEERLRTDFPDLDAAPLKPKRLRQFILIGYCTGLLLVPFILLFMLIEVVARVQAFSAGGPFRWELLGAYLTDARWGYLLGYIAFTAVYFLVPLLIFVFLSHPFLSRRAKMKVAS